MSVELLRQIARIDEELKQLDEMKKQLNEKRRGLASQVFENDLFGEMGMSTFPFDEPKRTVYLKEKWFAKVQTGINRDQAASVLVDIGFDQLVKRDFNLNAVTSAFKEEFLTKEGDVYEIKKEIPEHIKNVIDFKPFYTVESRKR